jgi:C4-dicarboxylate transporter DctM subunit
LIVVSQKCSKSVLPFIVTDLIRLVIWIAFPILALWLPSHMG